MKNLFNTFPLFINPGKGYVCIFNPFTLKKAYLTFDEYFKLKKEVKNGKGEIIEKLRREGFDIEKVNEVIKKLKERILKRVIKPSISYVVVTDLCNMKCKYCYFEGNLKKSEGKLTKKDIKRIVEFIRKESKKREYKLVFYGGEPLLHKDIIRDIVLSLKGYNVKISVITNATLVDEGIAKFFKENNVHVSVSMDGDIYSNSLRVYKKRNPFYKTLKGLCILKDNKVSTSVSCTISSLNVHKLPLIVKFFHSLGIKNFGFNILLRTKENKKYAPNPKVLSFFLYLALKEVLKSGMYENRNFRRFLPFLKEKFKFFDCPVLSYSSVDFSRGKISPCQGFIASDIYTVNDVKKLPMIFEEFRKLATLFNEECLNCEAIGICGGACPYHCYIKYGRIGIVDDYFCTYVKETLKYFIDIYYDEFVRKIRIVEASPEYFEKMVKLFKELKKEKYLTIKSSEELATDFLKQMELEIGKCFLAITHGKVVGFANCVFKNLKEMEIGIGILKDYRGKGIGSKLLKAVESYIFYRNKDAVAYIKKFNKRAINFFNFHGYKKVGEEKDKVVLKKRLLS